tara:strand:- start:315 stop:536 length:222 start_codon:yes stop_codon:yes gene_type:complete
MKRYTLKDFIKIIVDVDIIYGELSLNAATTVSARVRKKSLLKQLENINPEKTGLGFYGAVDKDKKGRKILKVL